MGKVKLVLLLSVLAVLYGCGASSKTARTGEYYNGEFVYDPLDGSVRFTDLATYRTMTVSPTGALSRLLDSGDLAGRDSLVRIFIEFTGRRIPSGSGMGQGAGPALMPGIAIDSLISAGPETTNGDRFTVSGIYESARSGMAGRRNLRLRPDYTFEITEFGGSEESGTITGIWFRTSRTELVLKPSEGSKELEYFSIDPGHDSIIKTGKDSKRVGEYKRVYI